MIKNSSHVISYTPAILRFSYITLAESGATDFVPSLIIVVLNPFLAPSRAVDPTQ